MGQTGTVTIDFNISGTIDTATSSDKLSGIVLDENIDVEKASGIYEGSLAEIDGEKVYINAASPLFAELDLLFVEVKSGALDIRFDAGGIWVPLDGYAVMKIDSLAYLGVRATPAAGVGTATYKIILAKKA